MNKGGPILNCPKCGQLRHCISVPLKKANQEKARNMYYIYHQDVSWYRRARQCAECQEIFLTAEVSQNILDQLIQLRKTLLQRRTNVINEVRKDHPWIQRLENVPKKLAQGFLRASCWWLTHSSGKPVRAPGHAERIYLDTIHGWAVDFGANTFLVGKAIERSGMKVDQFLKDLEVGKRLSLDELKISLKNAISGAVSNYNGNEYDRYPTSGSDLVFGAQSIDIDDASAFIIMTTNLHEILKDTVFCEEI